MDPVKVDSVDSIPEGRLGEMTSPWKSYNLPSGYVKIAIEAMAIEIVDLPIDSMVDLSIAMLNYQRVYIIYITKKRRCIPLFGNQHYPVYHVNHPSEPTMMRSHKLAGRHRTCSIFRSGLEMHSLPKYEFKNHGFHLVSLRFNINSVHLFFFTQWIGLREHLLV